MPSPVYNSFESIILNVKWLNHSLNFVSVYRPPRYSLPNFITDFTSFVSFSHTLLSPTIFTGDFNISFNSSSPYDIQFNSMLNSFNLKQCVNFPTHIHGNIIDYLIVPNDFSGISHICPNSCISDHFAITFLLDVSPPCPTVY